MKRKHERWFSLVLNWIGENPSSYIFYQSESGYISMGNPLLLPGLTSSVRTSYFVRPDNADYDRLLATRIFSEHYMFMNSYLDVTYTSGLTLDIEN